MDFNNNEDYVSGSRRLGQGFTPEEEAKALGFINYTLAPGDELMTCPYNTAHRVRTARFARHLNICRTAHVKEMDRKGMKPEFEICKYNCLHHVSRLEIRGHEINCPDAVKAVDSILQLQELEKSLKFAENLKAGNAMKGEFKKAEDGMPEGVNPAAKAFAYATVSVNDDDDSWEVEASENLRNGIKSYNPQKKLRQFEGLITQEPAGITTKAERKAFRKAQADAFEQKGGEFYDGSAPKMSPLGSVPLSRACADDPSDIRTKRARELQQIQRNTRIAEEHLSSDSRRRRKDQAVEEIERVLANAKQERMSLTSSRSLKDFDGSMSRGSSRSLKDFDERSETSEASTDTFLSNRGKIHKY